MKLPSHLQPSDFRLDVMWLPNGGTEDPLPGWRLRAYFLSEGVAHPAFGAAYGWNDKIRIRPQTLTNALVSLAGDPNVPSELMNYGGPLAAYAEDAMRERHVRMVQQARRLREDLAKAEAALEAEGLPRDA